MEHLLHECDPLTVPTLITFLFHLEKKKKKKKRILSRIFLSRFRLFVSSPRARAGDVSFL